MGSRFLGITVIFVAVIMTLMAWKDLAIPQDAYLGCTSWPCDIYNILRDFQTLIGGGIALVAAWIAARPAWLQLQAMAGQQEIAARGIIAQRMSLIEERVHRSGAQISDYLQDIYRTIYDFSGDETEYDSALANAPWAFNMSQRAGALLRDLDAQQASRTDTARVEESRASLIQSLRQLEVCFDNISAPGQYGGDPETSAEQQQKMDELEGISRENLPMLTSKLDNSRNIFNQVAEAEIAKFRERLRLIDDKLLR